MTRHNYTIADPELYDTRHRYKRQFKHKHFYDTLEAMEIGDVVKCANYEKEAAAIRRRLQTYNSMRQYPTYVFTTQRWDDEDGRAYLLIRRAA